MFKIGDKVKFKQQYIRDKDPNFNGSGVVVCVFGDYCLIVRWHNNGEWWLPKNFWELVPSQLEFDFMKE